jgi:hypothetical protein
MEVRIIAILQGLASSFPASRPLSHFCLPMEQASFRVVVFPK